MTDEADNIREFPGASRLSTPVPKILAAAAGKKLQDVVVLGWTDEGEFYFASSDSNGATVNWMLDIAKRDLLGVFDDE